MAPLGAFVKPKLRRENERNDVIVVVYQLGYS